MAGFFTIPTEALGGALLAYEVEYIADKRKLLLKEVTDPLFLEFNDPLSVWKLYRIS